MAATTRSIDELLMAARTAVELAGSHWDPRCEHITVDTIQSAIGCLPSRYTWPRRAAIAIQVFVFASGLDCAKSITPFDAELSGMPWQNAFRCAGRALEVYPRRMLRLDSDFRPSECLVQYNMSIEAGHTRHVSAELTTSSSMADIECKAAMRSMSFEAKGSD